MRELVVTNSQWHRQMRAFYLITWCLNCLASIESFLARPRPSRHHSVRCLDAAPLSATNDRNQPEPPTAFIDGYIPEEYKEILEEALQAAGFTSVHDDNDSSCVHRYTFSKATGMLRLTEASNAQQQGDFDDPPKWIPLVKGEENVLVANGWSFLDPDENEPLSAFDVHAANIESQYKPKWGDVNNDANDEYGNLYDEPISSLGFSLRPQSKAQVEQEASLLADDLARRVLLQGATDPPQRKLTANGYDFTGPSSQFDVERGVFCCAIGGLPLFTTVDLSPTTASSGWLSFSQPVCNDHVILVEPSSDSLDQRIEVLCAKTWCHLGHYFGTEGYCINASALKFLPLNTRATVEDVTLPISWRALESQATDSPSSSIQVVYDTCINTASQQGGTTETIAFGAGCFWHVEFAF
jgi:peptide methionine sulfoxide reductase MsrB